MTLIDFSNCTLSDVFYGGTEKKIGLFFNNERYLIKFPKRTVNGTRNNVINEYIGSRIFNLIKINSQETLLGTYKGSLVVACKDFLLENETFVPFQELYELNYDINSENKEYSYQDIENLLLSNTKLVDKEEALNTFYKMYLVDALLGNFDRHAFNRGFLKKDDVYKIAPIFDNGSSLFPNLVNEKDILEVLNSEGEINKRVYSFPTSQIKINNEKSSYFDVISSLKILRLNKVLLDLFPRIDLNKINDLIDGIPVISDVQKLFYKRIIKERYTKIIKYSYDKLIKEIKDGTIHF